MLKNGVNSQSPTISSICGQMESCATRRHITRWDERAHPSSCCSGMNEAGGSLTLEVQGRVESSPYNDGMVQHHQMDQDRLAR